MLCGNKSAAKDKIKWYHKSSKLIVPHVLTGHAEQVRMKLSSKIKEVHNYRHYILISIIYHIFPKYLDSDSEVKIKNTGYQTAFNYMAIPIYHVCLYIVQFTHKF